jgi:hypothetical protein
VRSWSTASRPGTPAHRAAGAFSPGQADPPEPSFSPPMPRYGPTPARKGFREYSRSWIGWAASFSWVSPTGKAVSGVGSGTRPDESAVDQPAAGTPYRDAGTRRPRAPQRPAPRWRATRPSFENATRQVDVLKAKVAQAPTAIARMRRCRDRPSSNLSYTTIVSPIDGVVGNRTLRVGQYVQAATQLMAVVPAAAALHHRKLQGDAAHQRPSGPACTVAGRSL